MAATLDTAPRPLSHAGNTHIVKLETNIGPPEKAAFSLTFFVAGTGHPSAGQTISFSFDGTVVVFTAAVSPDNSGLQIPTYVSGDPDLYVLEVMEHLRQNWVLTDDFNIYIYPTGGGLTIYIEAKESGAKVLALTGTASVNVVLDTVAGSTGFAQPNLTALLRVLDVADPDQEIDLITLQAPYDAATSQVDFDLRGAFDWLAPDRPTTASIAPASGATLTSGVTTGTVAKAALRFADRYGSGEPVAEAMLLSDPFYVIPGALSADTRGDFPYADDLIVLHNYRLKDSMEDFWKPVARDQPDWVYFYANDTTGFTYNFTLLWSTGASTTYTPSGASGISVVEKTIRWMHTGYTQCKLGSVTPPTAGASIVRYSVNIISGGHAIAVLRYEVATETHPWNMYLPFDNGLGGMETVWMKGKAAWKYNAAATEFQRAPNGEANTLAEGERDAYLAEATHAIEASTGWQPKYYIEHLRQLFLGKCWLVDKANSRFIRVLVDAKPIEVSEDDQDLFSLTVGIKYAVTDTAFNLF